jgi:hypothetical protein
MQNEADVGIRVAANLFLAGCHVMLSLGRTLLCVRLFLLP